MESMDPLELAVEYLLATRSEDDERVDRVTMSLAAMPQATLAEATADDAARLAFWVNLYNAAVLRQPHHDFDSWARRMAFFRRRALTISGRTVSFDAIEHGILRRSRWKLALGFGSNPRPSRFERSLRVTRIDPRVHFALNCAAASCPPIAAYDASRIDHQLDLATRSYLANTVEVRADRLTIPRIFLWFAGDFGGPPGIRRFLRHHGIDGAGRKLRFGSYDWTPMPGRWAADPGSEEPESDESKAASGR